MGCPTQLHFIVLHTSRCISGHNAVVPVVDCFFLNMFVFSSSCHPHHGSGHNSQCSVQLPQQVSAHHHDVKQCECDAYKHISVVDQSECSSRDQ